MFDKGFLVLFLAPGQPMGQPGALQTCPVVGANADQARQAFQANQPHVTVVSVVSLEDLGRWRRQVMAWVESTGRAVELDGT